MTAACENPTRFLLRNYYYQFWWTYSTITGVLNTLFYLTVWSLVFKTTDLANCGNISCSHGEHCAHCDVTSLFIWMPTWCSSPYEWQTVKMANRIGSLLFWALASRAGNFKKLLANNCLKDSNDLLDLWNFTCPSWKLPAIGGWVGANEQPWIESWVIV